MLFWALMPLPLPVSLIIQVCNLCHQTTMATSGKEKKRKEKKRKEKGINANFS
jgi:hypothetical protein